MFHQKSSREKKNGREIERGNVDAGRRKTESENYDVRGNVNGNARGKRNGNASEESGKRNGKENKSANGKEDGRKKEQGRGQGEGRALPDHALCQKTGNTMKCIYFCHIIFNLFEGQPPFRFYFKVGEMGFIALAPEVNL